MKVKEKMAEQALEWMKSSEAFVESEAPKIAQEILYYGFAESLILLTMCLIATGIAIHIVRKDWTTEDGTFVWLTTEDELEESRFSKQGVWLQHGTALLCGIFGITGTFAQSATLLQIWLAPRLYVIHQLKEIVA
jgi:hypothetical protein